MGGLNTNTSLFVKSGFFIKSGFLKSNNGLYFTGYSNVPPMNETNLANLGLTSEDIDARLNYLSTLGLTDITIYIGGNSPRTSASDTAVLILTDANCYIDADYTP